MSVSYNQEDLDHKIRMYAFTWLNNQIKLHADGLPRELLCQGFVFNGAQIHLMSPAQGIFKPKPMAFPISITTTFNNPYADEIFGNKSIIDYKYCGTNPNRWDNKLVREAGKRGIPLIYFHAIATGKYKALFPVFVVNDNPSGLNFTVMVDDKTNIFPTAVGEEKDLTLRRAYVTVEAKRRLYQDKFREIVLAAYKDHCALCRLHHRELLDASHIIGDAVGGIPDVKNGLSLCKIHHAAYDQNFIGISPDYIIEVRQDIMEETDGPMLKHGLQGMNKEKILLPRSAQKRPSQELLEKRFIEFKRAV